MRGRPKKNRLIEYGERGAELEQAFTTLRKQMQALAEAVTRLDRDLHAVVYELTESPSGRVDVKTLTGREARLAAGEAMTDVRTGEDILRTRRLPGLVAASPATLALAGALNDAKARFERLVAELPRDHKGEPRREILNKVCARVHLVQSARRVPILAHAPEWASFIWVSNGTSNKVLTRDAALRLLDRHERYCPRDPHPAGCRMMVAQARAMLAREAAGQRFVQARPVAPHLRVNLRGGGQRLQRHAYLPLFYPAAAAAPQSFPPGPLLPPGTAEDRRARARRSDYQREDKPIVQGLHLYRCLGRKSSEDG